VYSDESKFEFSYNSNTKVVRMMETIQLENLIRSRLRESVDYSL
jgi:hypothetical protein